MTRPPIFLDDLLTDPLGFQQALLSRARSLRQKLGLPDVVDEVGVVCPDVIAAAEHLERTYPGMGPFLLARGEPKTFRQDGEPRPFRTSVGFGYYQGVLIELAEAGDGSDLFGTHVDTQGGRITLHHLGFFAEGEDLTREVDGERRAFRPVLEGLGFTPRWEALVAAAGVSGGVTIFDTYEVAENLSIEFLDIRLLRDPDGGGGLPVSLDGIVPALGHLQATVGPRVFLLPARVEGELQRRWSLQWILEVEGLTPAQLWPWVTDPERMSRWAQAMLFQAPESQEQGLAPDEPGSVREVWLRPFKPEGRRRPDQPPRRPPFLREQVREVRKPDKPGEPWILRYGILEGGGVREQKAEMTLEPTATGTRLRWEVDLVPALPGAGPILAEIVDEGTKKSLEVLKRLLAQEPPNKPTLFDAQLWGVISGLLLGAGVTGHALRLVLLEAPGGAPGSGADGRHTVAAVAIALYGLASALTLLRKEQGLWIAVVGPFVGLTAIVVLPNAHVDLFQGVLGIPQFLASGLGIWLLVRLRQGRAHAERA